MDTNNHHFARLILPGLIGILLVACAGISVYVAQTPSQKFFFGVLTGMLIFSFLVFSYKAGQALRGKQS